MNRIKDFFYNISDIVLALIIIAVAAIVILWRVDVIVEYPSELVAKTYVDNGPPPPITTPHNSSGDDVGEDGSATGSGIAPGSITETPEMFSIYVNYGETTQQIAETIVSLGFFDTTEEFVQMVAAMGAETKLQTGNHVIPENATKEEVINYLMEPGL